MERFTRPEGPLFHGDADLTKLAHRVDPPFSQAIPETLAFVRCSWRAIWGNGAVGDEGGRFAVFIG